MLIHKEQRISLACVSGHKCALEGSEAVKKTTDKGSTYQNLRISHGLRPVTDQRKKTVNEKKNG